MDAAEQRAVKACQAGDIAAFGELYDLYIKRIYNFVYFKTHHKETAEDSVSLVFTKALEHINSFDADKGNFSAWLYRIARNTVIDHYRTNKTEKDVDDVWDLSDNSDIARDTDTRLQVESIQEHMQKLSSEQRDIIVMRLWQDMTHAQIAEVLGKNESAVKVAYSRALQELRKHAGIVAVLALFFR